MRNLRIAEWNWLPADPCTPEHGNSNTGGRFRRANPAGTVHRLIGPSAFHTIIGNQRIKIHFFLRKMEAISKEFDRLKKKQTSFHKLTRDKVDSLLSSLKQTKMALEMSGWFDGD